MATTYKCLAHKGSTRILVQITGILKSKKGHNSIKIQFRVVGLDIQGYLMTVNKCVKFQSDIIHKTTNPKGA